MKKGKLSLKVKALIAVYFVILVAVLSLVLINAIPGAGAGMDLTPAYQGYELSAQAISRIITREGIFCLNSGILLY
jgi:hypothetical protein